MGIVLSQKLNVEVASDIGQILASKRVTLGLTTQQVAERLLLSRKQITSLESGSLKGFYNARHFRIAAMKYVSLLDGNIDLSGLVDEPYLVGDIISESPMGFEDPCNAIDQKVAPAIETNVPCIEDLILEAPSQQGSGGRGSRFVTSMLLSAFLSAGLFLCVAFYELFPLDLKWPFSIKTDVQANSQPSLPIANLGASNTDTLDKTIPEEKSYITIELNEPCWIELRYTNGSITQKLYDIGTYMVFTQGELSGFVLGNVNAVRMQIEGKPIDLMRFKSHSSTVVKILGNEAKELLGTEPNR